MSPALVFRALGQASRLQIAMALAEREMCVAELRELVGESWSTVSEHRGVLRSAGVVASDKRGSQVVYRLALACVATFVTCLEATAAGSGQVAGNQSNRERSMACCAGP